MVVILIWPPAGENKYGHAALNTDKYHMSFWPNNPIYKEDWTVLKAAVGSVEASLIYHQDLDRFYEGRRDPVQYQIVNVTDDDVNRVYEQFLRDEGIQPDSVTKSEAEKIIANGERPEMPLSKTNYSYMTHLRKKHGKYRPFRTGQSCVSFCFNMVQMADSNDYSGWNSAGRYVDYSYGITSNDHRVLGLQEIIKMFWVEGAVGKPWYWWSLKAFAAFNSRCTPFCCVLGCYYCITDRKGRY